MRKIGSIQFAVNIMYNLGEALRDQSQIEEAKSVLEDAVNTARESQYLQQEMDLENILGEMDLAAGNLDRAVARHRYAVTLAKELDDQFGESWSIRNLAVALLESGEVSQAEEAGRMLLRALELARGVVQPENTMESLSMILKYWNRIGLAERDRKKFLQELEQIASNQDSQKYLDLCQQYKKEAARAGR